MNTHRSATVLTVGVLSLSIFYVLSNTLVFSGEVSSEPVSLGKGDHRLVYDSTHSFRLTKEGDTDHSLSRRPIEILNSRKVVNTPDRVLDVALARLGATSFIGTVHSQNQDGDVFTFLTIAKPEAPGSTVKAIAAEAFTCEKGHRILALNGNRGGDFVTLVVGRMSTKEIGGVVSSGRIIFHGCPFPSPDHARVGKFTPEYEPLLPFTVEPVEEVPHGDKEGDGRTE